MSSLKGLAAESGALQSLWRIAQIIWAQKLFDDWFELINLLTQPTVAAFSSNRIEVRRGSGHHTRGRIVCARRGAPVGNALPPPDY